MEALVVLLIISVLPVAVYGILEGRPRFRRRSLGKTLTRQVFGKKWNRRTPGIGFVESLFRDRTENRRDYYRNHYLKSEAWKRKRYVVMKRDHWKCVYCGSKATQVHHKRYAPKNIGTEPIDWLVSVCKPCHDAIHQSG